MSSVKRKRSIVSSSTKQSSNKRTKVSVHANNLPWKKIATQNALSGLGAGDGFDDGEMSGLMEMEELEGVQVVYGQDKSIKFLIDESAVVQSSEEEAEDLSVAAASETEEAIPSVFEHGEISAFEPEPEDEGQGKPEVAPIDEEEEWIPASTLQQSSPPATKSSNTIASLLETPLPSDCPSTISSLPFMLPFKHAFLSMKFTEPTPIQSSAWSTAFSENAVTQRDIIGIAQTGSGKTLAYALPILQNCLLSPSPGLKALILTPTRELALQVKSHLVDFLTAALSTEGRAPVNILAITGGMSIHKQRRQLSYGVDVLVATPGRLWDLVEEDTAGDGLAGQIKGIRFLVLDEADRMVESGHFRELDKIFTLLKREDEATAFKNDFGEVVPTGDEVDVEKASDELRTYVFSATMSKELQKNLKKPRHKRAKIKAGQKGSMGALGDLMEAVDFRDPDPEIINLIEEGATISSLKECSIECLMTEKDMHLYHFLLRYPGKTLVFLSSIDGIRRLHPLISVLNLGEVGLLHSGMQQKARLKALDRFTNSTSSTSVLLCTDVAARGLDIASVHHVVHYQLPRTADTYVHRSGRTARAGREGVSLQLVSPEEKSLQRELFKSLGRDVRDLEELPVEWSIMDRLKNRIDLARQIENANHKVTKANHDEKWLREAAEAMELDLDNLDSDDDRQRLSNGKSKAKVNGLKAELAQELARPLMRHGISAKYITAGVGGQANFADSMLNQTSHAKFIGASQSNAHGDAKSGRKKQKKKQKAAEEDQEDVPADL